MLVLELFQYFGRFVDDVMSGPNPFLTRLLKTTDSLLGGRITGIYPPYLRLEPSTDDPASRGYTLQMLDVALRAYQIAAPAGQPGPIIAGDITLFDKQSSPKYRRLHVLRYYNVFSQRALQSSYGVICGQLNRFMTHTTLPGDWVKNAALCMHRFHLQGFETSWLHSQMARWLHTHAEQYVGDTRIKHLGTFAWKRFW